MLNFKIYSFGQFRAPKTWFRAGHFGHARNPARNLDARNLAHPDYNRVPVQRAEKYIVQTKVTNATQI